MSLRVLEIIDGTSVDGPGLRTTIYFAGCRHHCHGCHNPQSWDMAGGKEMTVEEIVSRVVDNDFDVTFSGGDPLFQPIEKLTELAAKIKSTGKTIWLYTGFTFEKIASDPNYSGLLKLIDVVVDGPYIEELRDISLIFKGSSNQRLVNVSESLKNRDNKVIVINTEDI